MRWIKIHDSLLDWEWYSDSNMVRLWLHLLLKANYKDKKWMGKTIKRGQLVTGRDALSEELGISVRSIRTCLSRLVDTGEIIIKTTNKYSLITICKYEDYQVSENQNDQQTTNKRPTNDQQTTTAVEYIEYKNIRNNIPSKDGMSKTDEILAFFNQKMEGRMIPKVRGCSGKRKTAVQARLKEHGLDAVYEMITKASKSDFLNGRNNRSWVATFDWLFLPSNFQKVLEDNYKNGDNQTNNERADSARRYAEVIAQLAQEDAERAAGIRRPESVPWKVQP